MGSNSQDCWPYCGKCLKKGPKTFVDCIWKHNVTFFLPMLTIIILALSMTWSKCHCLRQLGWESIPCIMTKNSISSNHPITVCATFEYLNQFSENYIGMMQISKLAERHQLWSPTICKTYYDWHAFIGSSCCSLCSLALFRTHETEVEKKCNQKACDIFKIFNFGTFFEKVA